MIKLNSLLASFLIAFSLSVSAAVKVPGGGGGSGGGTVITGSVTVLAPLVLSGSEVQLPTQLINLSAGISNVVYLNGASNIVVALSNAVNNTRYVLSRDTFLVTPSKVRSNGLGAINMFHKTNIVIESEGAVIDGSAALGELLYITNSANITVKGIEFRGLVVTNTTLVSGIGHVWGGVGYHNVREFRFLNNRMINHHDHGIFDLGSQGGAWTISTNTFINYNFFDNIGSARTNEVIVKDGTAIVPSGGEVIGNYIQNSLRGIEPYIDNSNNPPINQNCIVRGNHIVNMIDDGILTAGNTNMHSLIIEDNVIEWYPGYTRRGSNVITSATGININGGQNVKIVRNRIYYAPNFDIDVPGNFEKFGFVIEDNSGYGYFYGASGGGGLEVTSSSAQMPNRGFSIKNNKFEFKRSFGIGLTGIRDSEISGNKLVNTGLDSTRQIWLYSDATTICSNLVLFGNHITSDERDTPTTSGIEIENLTLNTLLAGNVIFGQATNVHNLAGSQITQYNFDSTSTNRFAAIRDLNAASNSLYSAIGSGSATTNGTAVIASGTLVSSNRVDIGSAQQFSIFQSGGFFQLTDNTSGAALISADDSSGEVFIGTDSITPLISFQAPVNAGGNDLTNVASVVINGASTAAGYTILSGTNDVPVVTQAAASNSIPVTNIVGLIHRAAAVYIEVDCNREQDIQITNRLAANTIVNWLNAAQGQVYQLRFTGAASGGSDYYVTNTFPSGWLVVNQSTNAAPLAVQLPLLVGDGTGGEVNLRAYKHVTGTNLIGALISQYAE